MDEIKRLKGLCHHYLEAYIATTLTVPNSNKHYNKKKRNAYHRLAQELRTDAYQCHFRNMHTEEELRKALSVLQSWQLQKGFST